MNSVVRALIFLSFLLITSIGHAQYQAHLNAAVASASDPTPVTSNLILMGIAETYASSVTCGSLFNPTAAWTNLMTGGLAGMQTQTRARNYAIHGMMLDIAMQRMNLVAYQVGQYYQGNIPPQVRNDFANAAETIASQIEGWRSGTAYRTISTPGQRRPDGYEQRRWDSNQLRSYLTNPYQFIAEEIRHNSYATGIEIFRHNLEHRASGTRALLEGRPVDAFNLQAIGDMDVIDFDDH